MLTAPHFRNKARPPQRNFSFLARSSTWGGWIASWTKQRTDTNTLLKESTLFCSYKFPFDLKYVLEKELCLLDCKVKLLHDWILKGNKRNSLVKITRNIQNSFTFFLYIVTVMQPRRLSAKRQAARKSRWAYRTLEKKFLNIGCQFIMLSKGISWQW